MSQFIHINKHIHYKCLFIRLYIFFKLQNSHQLNSLISIPSHFHHSIHIMSSIIYILYLLIIFMQNQNQISQTQQITKAKKKFYITQTLFWIYHSLIILNTILLIVFSVQIKSSFQNLFTSNQYNHALETIQFWKMGYIIDVKIVSTMNCPQGYQNLIDYSWPGTVPGCSCNLDLDIYQQIIVLKGSCTSQFIKNNCSQIPSINPESMSFWKGKKLICIKRVKSLNFYNSTANTVNQCQIGQNYQVSTYQNISCPMTKVSNTSTWPNQKIQILDNVQNISLYHINSGGYPIAAFKLSEYKFCPFFNSSNITPNKQGNYILQNVTIKTCLGQDPRIITFDNIDQQSYFKSNYNIQLAIKNLPTYPEPSNQYIYNLGYITYPQWIYACRKSDNLNLNIATNHLLLLDQQATVDRIFIVTLIFSGIFGLIRLFYIGRRVKQIRTKLIYGKIYQSQVELCKKMPNLNFIKNLKNQLVILFLDSGIRLTYTIIIIVSIYRFDNFCIWHSLARTCTSDYLSNILSTYMQNLNNIYQHLIKLLILILVLILSDLLFTVFRIKAGDLQRSKRVAVQTSQLGSMNQNEKDEKYSQFMALQQQDVKTQNEQNEQNNELSKNGNKLNVFNDGDLIINKKKKKPLKRKEQFKKDDEQQF